MTLRQLSAETRRGPPSSSVCATTRKPTNAGPEKACAPTLQLRVCSGFTAAGDIALTIFQESHMTSVEQANQTGRRCAVIYNPTKVSEKFRALVEDSLQRKGWVETFWLETSAEDPGRAMTRQAVAEQVDLVIGAGGDGTIRSVADGLAHTGIPLGLVPAGTGNLLARNLDLPLEEVGAIEVALDGQLRVVDLVKITVDDRAPEHFAVMAGIGVDAMIMDETDEDLLKDKVGSAAYFVAAGKALGRLPVRMTVQLDTNRPVRRHAMLCVIGNVGRLRGNITLIPGCQPG